MRHSLNYSEWMTRLGLKRPDQPELIYGVQPVATVGDYSRLVSPVLAPMAWMGGFEAAVAGRYGCLEVTSRAPGGVWVRFARLTPGAAGAIRWAVTDTPGALQNIIACVRFDLTPDPTVTVVRLGTLGAEPYTIFAPYTAALVASVIDLPEFYIRPGYTLQAWTAAANTTLGAAVLFQDCPAQAPAR